MKKTNTFIINALILTGAALLLRTVGVAFNAYVANKIGASATGLYSLVTSVYFFAVTFATSGVTLAATRTVAEALGRGVPREASAAMRICITYAAVFGTVGAVALFFGAGFIGEVLLDEPRTVSSIRLFAISLPPIAVSSALSGYFTAVRRVSKSAAAGLVEQAIRVFVCSAALFLLAPSGIEYACIALVGGGAVAEVGGAAVMFMLYLCDKKKHISRIGAPPPEGLLQSVLGISLPVAFSAYLRAGLVTAEHALIPRGLARGGLARDAALASYGVIHGMVLPVVLYPSAISGAAASLLVPEFAKFRALGERDKVRTAAERVIRLTLVFAVATAGIMITFSGELGRVIYGNGEAAKYIRYLAPLIPVMYLDTAVDAMLKGLGHQVYSMWVNIADAAISVACVLLLLPRMGIYGYVVTIYVTELLNGILSIYKLLSEVEIKLDFVGSLIKPLASVVLANTLVVALLPRLSSALSLEGGGALAFGITLSAGAFAALYFLPIKRRKPLNKGFPVKQNLNSHKRT